MSFIIDSTTHKICDVDKKFNEIFKEIQEKIESIKDPRLINLNKLFEMEESEIEEFQNTKPSAVPLYASDYSVESLGGPSIKSYEGDRNAFKSVSGRPAYEDINNILLAESKLLRLGKFRSYF
jgi:hypothetical protein